MKYRKEILVAASTYIVLHYFVAWSVGMTSAIAMPEEYLGWYQSNDLVWLGILIWSLCTIYPATALPSLAIVFAGVKMSSTKWFPVCIVIIVLYVAHFLYGQISAALTYPQFVELNGYHVFIPGVVFPAFVLLGGYLAGRCINNYREDNG